MPDENEEQNVAGFRQKVCMYLMTSICTVYVNWLLLRCKILSLMGHTYVRYSAEAIDAHRATRQCASFLVTCILLPDMYTPACKVSIK